MRNPERIDEILDLVSKIWHKYPDLRLCQLISNCFQRNYLYYMEDDELKDKLIKSYPDS